MRGRDAARVVVAGCTVVAAAVHVAVIPAHLDEAPYMATLFILLTVACLGLAVALVVADRPSIFVATAACCGTALAGYALTRTVALPQLSDDVGDWLNPLGIAAGLAEAAAVILSLALVTRARSRAGAR